MRDTLSRGAAALGLTLGETTEDALLDYIAELAKWNRAYNLTSVREPGAMLVQHVLDSLSLLRHVRGPLADIGSGAGLPGIVLAIVDRSLSVTSIETVSKKARFQGHIRRRLSLDNLTVVDQRVEHFQSEAGFATVTCRAFASLSDFTRLTRHLLAADGRWLAMKGKHPEAEIEALDNTVRIDDITSLSVPGLAAERCLIRMSAV